MRTRDHFGIGGGISLLSINISYSQVKRLNFVDGASPLLQRIVRGGILLKAEFRASGCFLEFFYQTKFKNQKIGLHADVKSLIRVLYFHQDMINSLIYLLNFSTVYFFTLFTLGSQLILVHLMLSQNS